MQSKTIKSGVLKPFVNYSYQWCYINRISQIFTNFQNAKGNKSLTKAGNVVEASSSKHKVEKNELLEEFKTILKEEFKDIQYHIISSVSTFGINEIKEVLWNKLNQKSKLWILKMHKN